MKNQKIQSDWFSKSNKKNIYDSALKDAKISFKNSNDINQYMPTRVTNGLPLKNLNKLESENS